MSIARAIIWPGSFGDTSLPKVDLGYTPPLPGALYSWSAEHLPLGPIEEWFDGVSGVRMGTDAGAPVVFAGGLFRSIRFNGTEDRMRTLFPEPLVGPHSIVTVYRFTAPSYGEAVVSDNNGTPGAGTMSIDSNGNYIAYTDNSYIYSTPPLPADNSYKVGILTRDGTNSALRVNDVETIGTLSDRIDRRGLALGYATNGDLRSAIEIARMDVIPGPMEPEQRAAIVNALRARHGI